MELHIRYCLTWYLSFFIFLFFCQNTACGSNLYVGVSSVEIKPLDKDGKFIENLNMAGYSHNRIYHTAAEIHDPIWARAVSFTVNGKKVVLLSVDVVGLVYDYTEKIRERVSGLGIDKLIIASTHTHAGVDTLGLWGTDKMTDGKNPVFMALLEEYAELAIRKSLENPVPAKVRFGMKKPPVTFGNIVNDLRDPVVIDDTIYSMQLIDDKTGGSIAVIVNWSIHPETMGGTNSLISSDFPHYLRNALEGGKFYAGNRQIKGLGGTAVYMSGALGGMMTPLRLDIKNEAGEPLSKRSWEKTKRVGVLAAKTVVESLQEAVLWEIDDIIIKTKKMHVPVDNLYFKSLKKNGLIDRQFYLNETGEDTVLTEVNLLTFLSKGEVKAQMVTIPGELFPEIAIGGYLSGNICWEVSSRKKVLTGGYGWERTKASNPAKKPEPVLRNMMKGEYKFIIGLANDELGYIIPENDFVFPVYSPKFSYGTDKCGDSKHYEETMSASSRLASSITEAVMELLNDGGGI